MLIGVACDHISAVVLWRNLNTAVTNVWKKFFRYYRVTEMLLALGLPSFDTVIHNYRKYFMRVWSKHIVMIWWNYVWVRLFFMSFNMFYCTSCIVFFISLILSICLSADYVSCLYVYGACCMGLQSYKSVLIFFVVFCL